MLLCAVSLMLREAVSGINAVQLFHISVPGDLGQDAGRGDGQAFGVPFDNGNLGDLQAGDGHRVIEQDRRRRLQGLYSQPHGFIVCLQDIDLIDPVRSDHDHGPGQGLLPDLVIKHVPFFGTELFGIVEPEDLMVCRQDHRAGRHRPGQGASACFINAADQAVLPILPGCFLFKGPHAGHPQLFLFQFRFLFLCHSLPLYILPACLYWTGPMAYRG